MSFVENQGVSIYWDEQGTGPPLLLIMGLGYSSGMWYRTRPGMATRYRTIALDNRGVGQSDAPLGPYPMALMASDAAAVLEAAGVKHAHTIGVSMGGMIAQEFALQHPDRVHSLVLGCTAPGGSQAVKAEPGARDLLMARSEMTPDQAMEASVPYIYASSTPRARIEEDFAVRRKCFPSPRGYMAQLQGILSWEAYSRLSTIQAPTLVIHGDCDRLVPPANGQLIADRIPGAKLVILSQASHIFTTDQPEASLGAILEFLSEQENQ